RIVPNMPTALKKPTITETAKTLLRKSEKGTIGWPARRSMKKNAVSRTADRASRPSTSGEVHACVFVIERAISIGARPAASVKAPVEAGARTGARERADGRRA